MERMMTCIQLLLFSLAFSCLIASCLAVPTTRYERMPKVARELLVVSDAIQLVDTNEIREEPQIRRMDVEINDYPISSANYRHTPKPPE